MPLDFGSQRGVSSPRDQCLQVKLRVTREQSSCCDRNIMPLLAALNVVAIFTLALDAASFGARGETILAISFVEIGIRLTVDSRLPVRSRVSNQNAMDLINNFFGLLFLVMESNAAYVYIAGLWNERQANRSGSICSHL
jgi:hypothetical protein